MRLRLLKVESVVSESFLEVPVGLLLGLAALSGLFKLEEGEGDADGGYEKHEKDNDDSDAHVDGIFWLRALKNFDITTPAATTTEEGVEWSQKSRRQWFGEALELAHHGEVGQTSSET